MSSSSSSRNILSITSKFDHQFQETKTSISRPKPWPRTVTPSTSTLVLWKISGFRSGANEVSILPERYVVLAGKYMLTVWRRVVVLYLWSLQDDFWRNMFPNLRPFRAEPAIYTHGDSKRPPHTEANRYSISYRLPTGPINPDLIFLKGSPL